MTAVPVAIDALVAAFVAQFGTQAQVVDGPPAVDVRGDVVAVGLAPQESDVDSVETVAGLQAVRQACTVHCLARSWSGNDRIKAQRDRTYALIAGARARLRADPTLGGQVQQARYAGETYTPWRTEGGLLVVDVPFRVDVVVLTNS